MADDRGQVVEGVRELRVAGCVAVPEPGIVRCDEVEPVGEPVQQRLPHAGRGGESMQEQDRGRVLRAGLAIEDRQAVYADGAVRRATHGCLRSHQGWTGPGVQARAGNATSCRCRRNADG
jgi:hypothetical protein